jgi:hypothetical protein
MKHNLHTSEDCTCIDETCFVCKYVTIGGLAICKTCGGAEITLTTDCVGRKLTENEEEMITADRWDFKDGQWYSIPAVQAILNKSTKEKTMKKKYILIRDRKDPSSQIQICFDPATGELGVAHNNGLEVLEIIPIIMSDIAISYVTSSEEVIHS